MSHFALLQGISHFTLLQGMSHFTLLQSMGHFTLLQSMTATKGGGMGGGGGGGAWNKSSMVFHELVKVNWIKTLLNLFRKVNRSHSMNW